MCLTPASLSLTPAAGYSVAFGTVSVGTTKRQIYNVSSEGQQSSSAITISVTGSDFSRVTPVAGDCVDGMVLVSGAQCAVHIDFTPASAADIKGSLMVSANVGGTMALELTGTGKQLSGVVTEFDVPQIVMSSGDPQSMLLTKIISGSDGNLWFLENTGSRIVRATTSGVMTSFTIPNTNLQINDIATGPDGNIWYTNGSAHSIGRLTTQGGIKEFPAGQHGQFLLQPGSIRQGGDGNMWFFTNDYSIARITIAGVVTGDFVTMVSPAGLLRMGPDMALWFSFPAHNSMAKIDVSGTIVEMTGISNPNYWTAGPDGNLWATFGSPAAVGRIPVSGSPVTKFMLTTAGAVPSDITAGPDGNLWFIETIFGSDGHFPTRSSLIGRITPSGSVTEFPIPNSRNIPNNIVSGADGNLWFTENTDNSTVGKLARITP